MNWYQLWESRNLYETSRISLPRGKRRWWVFRCCLDLIVLVEYSRIEWRKQCTSGPPRKKQHSHRESTIFVDCIGKRWFLSYVILNYWRVSGDVCMEVLVHGANALVQPAVESEILSPVCFCAWYVVFKSTKRAWNTMMLWCFCKKTSQKDTKSIFMIYGYRIYGLHTAYKIYKMIHTNIYWEERERETTRKNICLHLAGRNHFPLSFFVSTICLDICSKVSPRKGGLVWGWNKLDRIGCYVRIYKHGLNKNHCISYT